MTTNGTVRVEYRTPFRFSGKEVEVKGKVYRLADRDDFYAFRQFADSLEGFSLQYNKTDEVMTWDKKVHGEDMKVIKMFGVFAKTAHRPDGISVAPEQLYDMLQDAIFRETWDNYRLDAFEIERLDERNDIGYYAAHSPVPLVANRDFVNQRMWCRAENDEYVIFNTSVPHDAVPPNYQKSKGNKKTFVRATSKLTGYLIRPWRDPVTHAVTGSCLTYITQVDPNGWVPTSVTNLITGKFAPKTMQTLGKAAQDFQQWLPKQISDHGYTKTWETDVMSYGQPVQDLTIDFAKEKWGAHHAKKLAPA